ncbi:MAG: hypothetical protein KDA81_00750 [Planctomycetaceae bacterium]|nr:hypothetical protein [Planctomycetaceae bacterium]
MNQWRLMFTGAQSVFWTISVIAAVLLAVALFIRLRRYEARLVSPTVGRILLALRVLVLLVLLLAFLQPVLTRRLDSDRPSRVVVAIDVSESMQTADRHASPVEMLRWAQALGMLGNTEVAPLLDSWAAALEAGEQPDWGAAVEGEVGSGPAVAELRRQHMQGVFTELAKMSRMEFVRRLLEARPHDLLKQLSDVQAVDLRVFGTQQTPVLPDQLREVLNSDLTEINPGGTDAVGVLTESISEPDGNNISGIVLLSDGRQTTSADVTSEAARLGSLGVPVYCIPIGSQLTPRDLSVASLEVPQTVFLEDTAQVRATISSSGYAGDRVNVQLFRNGEVVDQREVDAAGDHFDVEFGIPTAEVGNQEYRIVAEAQPGELRDDNNDRTFTVSVVDNKSHVMLLEGDARWEFRYLNSALERDKRVALTTVLFDQPFLHLLNNTFLNRDLPEMDVFQEQLASTDIVIVGDVAAERLPEPVWEALEHAVETDGLTLLVIPGKDHMPHTYQSPILRSLLPVEKPVQQLAERYRRSDPDAAPTAFRLDPTPDAADLTLFRLSAPGEAGGTDFSGLPGHPWAYSATPLPGASVWANLQLDAAELTDRAVIVHQYYGFGQVVWMGIDSTWRWRFRAGDTWHHRFWGQLVRWAARNKSAAGNDQVRLTLSDMIIDDSESVEVAVRWNPGLADQLKDARTEVILESMEDSPNDAANGSSNEPPGPQSRNSDPKSSGAFSPQSFPLTPVDGAPERFTTRLHRLKPGSYRVRLNVENSRIRLESPVTSELIVQKQLSTELANISCNRPFLEQVATLSGGRVFEPWTLDELPELLRPKDQTEVTVQERTLWDHWSILLLFFALLTAEWVLRKIHGLP